MKFIPFVAEVPLKNMMGRQLEWEDENGNSVKATISHWRFLTDRMSDPKFFAGKKQAEAVLLSVRILSSVEASVKRCERGAARFIPLEEDWHERFLKTATEPTEADPMRGIPSFGYPPNALHCYAPFIESVENPLDEDPDASPVKAEE